MIHPATPISTRDAESCGTKRVSRLPDQSAHTGHGPYARDRSVRQQPANDRRCEENGADPPGERCGTPKRGSCPAREAQAQVWIRLHGGSAGKVEDGADQNEGGADPSEDTPDHDHQIARSGSALGNPWELRAIHTSVAGVEGCQHCLSDIFRWSGRVDDMGFVRT
jgi:hypothetical protein